MYSLCRYFQCSWIHYGSYFCFGIYLLLAYLLCLNILKAFPYLSFCGIIFCSISTSLVNADRLTWVCLFDGIEEPCTTQTDIFLKAISQLVCQPLQCCDTTVLGRLILHHWILDKGERFFSIRYSCLEKRHLQCKIEWF